MTRYVTPAETARQVRATLKRAFPGVRFSVRSATWSAGGAVTVTWTDGPAPADVDQACQPHRAADGMVTIETRRHLSGEYQAALGAAAAFLGGGRAPFDGAARYRFTIGGRDYDETGHVLAYQLSRTDERLVEAAVQAEAGRRAAAALAAYTARQPAGKPLAGWYVSVQDGQRHGVLLGPYEDRETAEADLPAGKALARQANSRAVFYAFGIIRVAMKPGNDLPAGRLEPLPARQLALAGFPAAEPAGIVTAYEHTGAGRG